MKSFYLGIDVSKGYSDFVIINQQKQPVLKNFQLDDTFEGHNHLYEVIHNLYNLRSEKILNRIINLNCQYNQNRVV
jgi:hypothetical protein